MVAGGGGSRRLWRWDGGSRRWWWESPVVAVGVADGGGESRRWWVSLLYRQNEKAKKKRRERENGAGPRIKQRETKENWGNGWVPTMTSSLRVDEQGRSEVRQTVSMSAPSAAMVEVRARLLILQWAIANGVAEICIETDSVVFVRGIKNPTWGMLFSNTVNTTTYDIQLCQFSHGGRLMSKKLDQ
ncbi:hypothetical protein RHMOL_Rhmol04G0053500 [Rhododendron molle]|uniref:Uncharacterized protein n=1 Tax=Rhododendron molle TaxID=49168 RepID=A0ACC0NZN3_RHOML|nr:hypothetical protein RHMOL_Rhmol04G0053500 [Rhododendron molle]